MPIRNLPSLPWMKWARKKILEGMRTPCHHPVTAPLGRLTSHHPPLPCVKWARKKVLDKPPCTPQP